MKNPILIIILFSFFLLPNKLSSQISPDHYLVNLTDKKDSKYSVQQPDKFLSERAILRRTKYNIPYDEMDMPVNDTYINGLKSLGLKIVNVSKWTNSVTVYTKDSLLIDTLDKLPYVKSVGFQKFGKSEQQKNLLQKTQLKQFGIQSVDSIVAIQYGQSFNQIKIHNGHLMHKEGFQGQGIQIAILDGGFYKVNELPAFDSIRLNNQILGTRDFVDGDNEVYDASDHGMKVLSTMAGNLPGQLLGTAPKAKYWLLRSEQTASEYLIEEHNWVVAAEFADSVGVDLINSSLGYTEFDDSSTNHSYNDLDGNTSLVSVGADIAAKKGILVVNSAGNEGFGAWKYIGCPADADSILTVGAVMNDGRLAYFSSVGPTYDSRIKPDVCAIGLSPVVSGNSGGISYSSGTSFSSPIMAGWVACLWQSHPELNNMEIIEIIRRSSSQYNAPDNSFGYGIPDIYAAHIYLKTSGLIDLQNKSWMNVFPNPFKDEFNIEFLSQSINIPYNMHIQLFDIQGKMVSSELLANRANNFRLENMSQLQNMKNGIYILRLTADNIKLEKKIMKY